MTQSNDSRQQHRTRRQFTAAALVLVASVGWAQQVRAAEPILSLAIAPDTPTTLYAGTYCSGVLKSLDGGDHWSNTGLTKGYVRTVAIDPVTLAVLYAGTWDDGAFRSLNGGSTWQAIGLADVHALAIDPTTPTTLYAGLGSGGGVSRSLDGGSNWSAVNTGLTDSGTVFTLAIDPATPTTLYAGTDAGVFRSLNGGNSWNAVNAGLTTTSVLRLAINPTTPTILYAATGYYSNSAGGGMFRSVNGGGNWSAVNTGLPDDANVVALAIDPTTPTILYAGTYGGVFRSLNGGGSWQATDLANTDVRALAINPTTPTTIYAATWDRGVLRSLNGGNSWQATGLGAEPICGDGLVRCGEECDDGAESAKCDADCTLPQCGDGTLNVTAGEQCDDGNRNPFDGCTNDCTVCGNGVVTPPEECDDGKTSNGDGCDAQCHYCDAQCSQSRVVGTGTPQSCTEAAFAAALAHHSVIFNCGPAPVTITLRSEKAIAADTIIDGGGLITLSGGGAVRIFKVDAGAALDVRNLTLADGSADVGGGIENGGTLTLTACTLSGNSAGWGGGIYNAGTVTLTNCTLSGNSADRGGGIINYGTLSVSNSTFSGNSAVEVGGAIGNVNGCGVLGGCYDGSVTLTNTIVANSPSGGDCAGGEINDGGHNLIEDATTSCGLTNGVNGNLVGTDPLLGPLANNGGPTQTIALLAGSPAIDAGDPQVCADAPVSGVDQRGFVRPGTGHAQCSIGAYEADGFSPEPCVGDCDGTGRVTVDDLITMVNIALGAASMSTCEAGDVNADGELTVDEVITAVRVALGGCPTGPPFPWELGPFGVGVRRLAFTKQSATQPAEERVLLTDIWYPTEPNAGAIDATLGGVVDAPRAANTGNLPLVLFSHGSCGNPEQSRFLTTALASYGFVVAAPPHRGNVLADFPSFDDCQSVAASTYAALNSEREADIRFVIDSLLQLNVDPESFFAAAIDPNRIGVSGHSFGGETTQRVCARDPRVRAGLVLAMGPAVPWKPIHLPIMVHAGERDGFVPLLAVQLLFRRLLAPKYFVEIFHTGHTAFIDDCLVFFPACDGAGPGALTQDEAHQLVLRYAVPFLLHHVAGDGRFDAYLGPAPGVGFTATGVD